MDMADQENNIEILESQFPAAAGPAFAAARGIILAAGLSVLESESGVLYEVFPDGSRRWVKEIEPPIPVVSGHKITIR